MLNLYVVVYATLFLKCNKVGDIVLLSQFKAVHLQIFYHQLIDHK